MTKSTHTHILVGLATALLGLAALTPAAEAGRGGSFDKIRAAARNGNPDAIVAEVERAENIPCTAECMRFVKDLLGHDSYYVRDAAAWWFARRPAQRAALNQEALAILSSGGSLEVRNAAASRAHRKTRLQQLHRLGIDPDQIKSVLPEQPPC